MAVAGSFFNPTSTIVELQQFSGAGLESLTEFEG
jgi:hypothetical protein